MSLLKYFKRKQLPDRSGTLSSHTLPREITSTNREGEEVERELERLKEGISLAGKKWGHYAK